MCSNLFFQKWLKLKLIPKKEQSLSDYSPVEKPASDVLTQCIKNIELKKTQVTHNLKILKFRML